MAEYSTTDQGQRVAQGAAGGESIDLLIRHLESAKQVFSIPAGTSTQDEELTTPDTFCTLIYAQPGTFCPLLYIHFPAVVEEVTDTA